MIYPQMMTSQMMTTRVMLDVARAAPTTPPNHLIATDVSIVNIEVELTAGGDIINRGKYVMRTAIEGVLVDKTAVTEHILLQRLTMGGTDRDKYDGQNEFDDEREVAFSRKDGNDGDR
jgi:hypothetical protein